ncbi:UDP-2,3-diacylglucosamine diphosphatase [Marinobacteraceae bacterium S3BR75-40.1]
MYRYRSVFISDLHLGSPDCQAYYLYDFLKTVRCETLYLVGDIVDLIAMQRKVYLPESHRRVARRLVALAREGTRVVYIPGNHDEFFRSFCGQHLAGIEFQRTALHVTADGRRFRVCHGDQFDQVVRYSPLMFLVGDHAHGLLLWLNRWLNRWRRVRGQPYWSLAAYLKQRIGKARAFIDRFERAALAAAERGRADGYICGHIHSAGFRAGNNGLYCNDGDWVEHCTALVEDDSGALSLLHWSERPQIIAREPALAADPGQALPVGPLASRTTVSG